MNNINMVIKSTINYMFSKPSEESPLILPEILKTIFAQFNIKSLGRISTVSKEWNAESSRDDLWILFANQFNVNGEGSDFKSQFRELETGLGRIYLQINKKMWERPSNKFFFKELTAKLFKDNIKKIETQEFLEEDGIVSLVTLTLSKEKQVSFDNTKIFNMRIPKKVSFIIKPNGFTFMENNDFWKPRLKHPIELNCSTFNFSSNFCKKIETISPCIISVEWEHVNILEKNKCLTWTKKETLLNTTGEEENVEMCNLLR